MGQSRCFRGREVMSDAIRRQMSNPSETWSEFDGLSPYLKVSGLAGSASVRARELKTTDGNS